MDHFDVCIIGAGVIGLAIARSLSQKKLKVLVVEQHSAFGTQTSSRNSEVIHAGLYYTENSLKARLCVEGKERLYHYCETFQIPFRKVGKLIVAVTASQTTKLEQIERQAQVNGVNDLIWLDRPAINQLEPEIVATHALLSPSTGIVDSFQLMQNLCAQAERQQAVLAFNTSFEMARKVASGFQVRVNSLGTFYRFCCDWLINAAGLQANDIAQRLHAELSSGSYQVPGLFPCKGDYFSLTGKAPFSHLIYPVPEHELAGLGIHATLDMNRQVKFGPDVEYLQSNELDYRVNEEKKLTFIKAIKGYYPFIKEDRLVPAYSGIRPKLQAPGEPASDFRIDTKDQHGVEGLIHLLGIESPGLTSCLAMAEHIAHHVLR